MNRSKQRGQYFIKYEILTFLSQTHVVNLLPEGSKLKYEGRQGGEPCFQTALLLQETYLQVNL